MSSPPPSPLPAPPENSPQIPESQILGSQLAPSRRSAHTSLRNRRFAALRELLRGGEYFSEEQMRLRAPALFHHYIGRFQETPKIPQNHPRNPKNHPKTTPNLLETPKNPKIHPKNTQNYLETPKNHPKNPKIYPQNTPNLLETPKNHIEIPKNPIEIPKNLIEIPKNPIEIPKNDPKFPGNPKISPTDPKSGATEMLREILLKSLEENIREEEEEEEEEEDEDEDEEEERIPDEAEKELLRLEFTTRMYQSFLEGLDGDFDYSQVDENPDLDNLDILSRDLEEQYFDEEEPSEAPNLD